MAKNTKQRLALFLGLLTAAVLAQARIIKVTYNGTDSFGVYWATPTSLENALAIAKEADEIWLAQGVYSNSTAAFTVRTNCALYGGFTIGMATREERNWSAYPTVLDGNAKNLRVVLVTGTNVTLDGLSIINSSGAAAGGITKAVQGTLVLANCRIMDHTWTAGYAKGVGASFTAGTILMTNCIVARNRASGFFGYGCGVYSFNANLKIVDCAFTNNNQSADRGVRGAGVYASGGALEILRTDFSGNWGYGNDGGGGGGVCVEGTLAASFSNCVFRGNRLLGSSRSNAKGGGMWVNTAAAATIRVVNCTFKDNMNGFGNGGGVYLANGALLLKNSILWTNVVAAGYTGNEIYRAGGVLTVSFCDLSGLGSPHVVGGPALADCMTNDPLYAGAEDLHLQSPAGRWDPAIGDFVTTDVAYSPCIDAGDPEDPIGDEAADNGNVRINMGAYGGTAQAGKSPPPAAPQLADRGCSVSYDHARISGELTNDVHVSAQIYLCYGTTSISEDTTNGWDAVMNVGLQHPGAIFSTWTPALLPETAYFYRWLAVSSAGSNWTAAAGFETGAAGPGGGADVIHVDCDAIGAGDGSAWAHAFPSLADALIAIGGTRTNLWIAGRTYREKGQLMLAQSAAIIGGFAGTESSIAARALTNAAGVVTNYTVIDGEAAHPCIAITAGNVLIDSLELFNSKGLASGGGISKSGSGELVMINCRMVKNTGTDSSMTGIGGCFTGGSVLLTNCVVADNNVTYYFAKGIGLYASGADLRLVDCVISNNSSAAGNGTRGIKGLGLYFNNGRLSVLRTDFLNNKGSANAGAGGGAVCLDNAAATRAAFSNCVFRGNEALVSGGFGDGVGGAMWLNMHASATARVVNCTFKDNVNRSGNGGAIYLANGTLHLKNSILWTNGLAAGYTGSELYQGGGTLDATYCDFAGLSSPHVVGAVLPATCRADDPLYAGAADVHLQSPAGRWDPAPGAFVTTDTDFSPCIDAGDPADPIGGEPPDNGNIRINMGAYGGLAQASKSPPPVVPRLADRGCSVNYDHVRISGELTNDSFVIAQIYLCYGTGNVAGDSTNGWGVVVGLGEKQNGTVFSMWTPALSPNTTYYYRWYAVNADGSNWTAAASFLTGSKPSGGGEGVIHVDRAAAGAADGCDWANAFTRISDAVAALSAERTQIWITGGTYAEGFPLPIARDGWLIGGFAGTETAISARALTNAAGVVTNYTIIDGEASHPCIAITAGNVLIDSLELSNSKGTASGGGISKSGPGELVMVNCRLVKNTGAGQYMKGIGGYFTGGSVLLTNCVVADNNVQQFYVQGIGLYSSGADLRLVDCVISNNSSAGGMNTRGARGLGLCFNNGSLSVLRTDFLDNKGGANAGGGGGAVCLDNAAATRAAFSNCVFRGNEALASVGWGVGYGGAMWLNMHESAAARVVNCTFKDNVNREGDGGAIHLASGTLHLKNCILWTNAVAAGYTGSELYQKGGTLDANYCDFSGLSPPYVVGAVLPATCRADDPLYAGATDLHLQSPAGRWDPAAGAFVTTDTDFSPCIDAGDPADPIGDEPPDNGNIRINMGAYGGLAQASKSPPPIVPLLADRGCSVNYDHVRISGELTNDSFVIAQIYLCYGTVNVPGDSTNGWGVVVDLGEKQNGTVFAMWSPALLPNTTYYYRWYAVNADGSNWTAAASFLTGSKSSGGGEGVIHVDQTAAGAADGGDWANAFTCISDAVAALSAERNQIWITGGTYAEGSPLSIARDAWLIGGFAGTETSISERAFTNAAGVVTNYTVIDGEALHPCIAITAGNVLIDSLELFNSRGLTSGGGISKSGSGELIMVNCRIVKNTGTGGSMTGIGGRFTGGSILLTNCVVADNNVTFYFANGIGLYASGADLRLVDCVISNNSSAGGMNTRGARGLGLCFNNGSLSVLRTDFLDNKGGANAGGGGGAVCLDNAAATRAAFSNCVFRGNEALASVGWGVGYGGAMWLNMHASATARVVNCTFKDNVNREGDGGAIHLANGMLHLKNSILWTNAVAAGYTGSELFRALGRLNCAYCALPGTNAYLVAGAVNLIKIRTKDPLFAGATDLHLQSARGRWNPETAEWTKDTLTSPAIDAGDPTDPVGMELEPNRRVINLGAYGGTVEASLSVIPNGVVIEVW